MLRSIDVAYRNDGVLRSDDLGDLFPTQERLRSGPVVIIECVENIPCDPCVAACPKGAIRIDGDINGVPVVNFETCDGCGVCLSACPGLAIFGVDMSGDGATAVVRIPYEYLPLPEAGEEVIALDREGSEVGEARVTRVLNTKALDRTPIVSLEVPGETAMAVRHFRRKGPSS